MSAIQILAESVMWRKTSSFKYPYDHEYILRSKVPAVWDALAKEIDEKGVMVKFFSKEYRVLVIGEYRYWRYDEVLNRGLVSRTLVEGFGK